MRTCEYYKWSAIILIAAGYSLVPLNAHSQGFQDIDFEQANPGPLTQGQFGPPYAVNVPVANALPGWSVYYGNAQQSAINVNDPSLGAAAITLIAPGYPPIDGNYSALLQGSSGGSPVSASISQTGLIPAGTQSLTFEAQHGRGVLDVSIGGQVVSFTAIVTGPNYIEYGANISAWAGTTEQLTFSALGVVSSDNNWLIDDISFSQTAVVPEPSSVLLTGIGGLLFAARKWFARR